MKKFLILVAVVSFIIFKTIGTIAPSAASYVNKSANYMQEIGV